MPHNNSGGFFITLEGGEGAGKSTIQKAIADRLRADGYAVDTTREPGGSPLGESIRSWLLENKKHVAVSSQAELLLFLAARAQLLEELIKPSLHAGRIVLCDRFNDSTVAYQGGGRGLGIDYVQQLCDLVCHSVQPNLTLFLDISPKQGLERAKKAEKEIADDRFESEQLTFHENVYNAFKQLAHKHPHRIVAINAAQPLSEVIHESIAVTLAKMKDYAG
jgi:dTMP kinase